MTDPIRWSDAGDSASPLEQALVRSGQELPMPAGEKRAVLQGILGALPAGVTTPLNAQNTASPVAAKAAAVAGPAALLALKGTKALLVFAALAGLGAGGYHWLKKSRELATPEPTQGTTVPTVSPSPSVAFAPQVASEPPRLEAPTPSLPTTQVPAQSHASQLKEESLAVMQARQALRSNDAGGALHLLEQARLKFKRGALSEEREALTIEALAKAGQSARASARAQAFLVQYPRSPHAADVQRFIAK